MPDSPKEPDEIKMVSCFKPLNIPLEDISGEEETTYNYMNYSWPESKDDLKFPIIDNQIGMNKQINMGDQMLQQSRQQPQCRISSIEVAQSIDPQQPQQNFGLLDGSCGYITQNNVGYNKQKHNRSKKSQNSFPTNRNVKLRICKFFAKQGFCKKFNCAFLHTNNEH